ncbi:hypothetical protein M1329_00510 [Candidatus Marsarchaeota archaeon]|nr:hypothetical protein [Candidatus Marsarchaeota archaeon]MCL5099640.1 hypothetical protein [Candidatus Marsarchaeota archaeon]
MTDGATIPASVTFYDVDSVADIKDLIKIDPLILDDNSLINKMDGLNSDDLLLVKKVRSGAIKIVDITKIDPTFISKYLK